MRFTPGELAVMRLLWEYGEQKPSEIQMRFPETIKNPALRSYLTILVQKGHITRRKAGKAYFYKARTKQKRAFRSMLGDLADAFSDGSLRGLLFQLAEEEQLTEADIKELQSFIKDATKPRKGRKK